MHPDDMILEQSNDDDSSYLDRRVKRGVDLLGDAESISLLVDDYIIEDQDTNVALRTELRSRENGAHKRQFFEDNLLTLDRTPSPDDSKQQSSAEKDVNVHVSQLGMGLTDNSEDECDEKDNSDESDFSDVHFQIDVDSTKD